MWEEKLNEIGVILLLTLFSFWGVFVRSWPFGYDSYAFVNASSRAGLDSIRYLGFNSIIDFIPDSFLVYSIIMFLVFFVSLCGLYFAFKSFFGDGKAFLVLLVLLAGAPILIFDFAQFQNELFAYPFIFWSFYFISVKRYWFALGLALLGAIFWLGAVVWIGIVAVGLLFPFVLCCLLLAPFIWENLRYAFGEYGGVLFNTWFYGLIDYFFLFLFIFPVFLEKNKRVMAWVAISLICVCFSARYVILSLPFIAFGIAYSLPKLEKWLGSLKIVCFLAFFLIFCWNVALLMQHPTSQEMALVQDFVNKCDSNTTCLNDWSFGWWVEALGGKTSFKAGPPSPDYNNTSRPYYALTQEELECELISGEPLLKLYWCDTSN